MSDARVSLILVPKSSKTEPTHYPECINTPVNGEASWSCVTGCPPGRGPRRIDHVSASQVEKFLRCERYWYNRWCLGLPVPKTAAQGKGTAIHAALEGFVRDGTVPSADMLPYVEAVHDAGLLPSAETPREQILLEHEIRFATYPGGPDWLGFIDLFEEAPGEYVAEHFTQQAFEVIDRVIQPEPPDSLLAKSKTPRITDYKSTSDLKYAKTAAELATNVQVLSYAKWFFDLFPEIATVGLRHVYITTKEDRRTTREVTIVVDRALVERYWRSTVVPTVQEMVRWAASGEPDGKALPPNRDACGDYGGCAFVPLCGLSLLGIKTKESTVDTGQPKMTLVERLKANAAKNGAAAAAAAAPVPPVTAAPAPAPAPIVAPEPPVGSPPPVNAPPPPPGGLAERLKAAKAEQLAKGGGKPAPVAPAAPATAAVLPPAVLAAAAHVPSAVAGPPPSILPPDAGPRTSTPADVAAAVAGEKKKRGRPSKADLAAKLAGETVAAPAETPVPATAVAPTSGVALRTCGVARGIDCLLMEGHPGGPPDHKRADGTFWHEPDGAVPQTRATVPSVLVTARTVAPVPAVQQPTVVANAAPSAAADTGPVKLEEVFIDAWPVKGVSPGDIVLAEEFMAPILKLAAELGDVPDFRLISYTSKGVLATALRSRLSTLPRVLVVSSFTPGSDVLLETVIPYAKRVVRALRG